MCQELAEAAKAHLRQKASRLFRDHAGEPVLFVYSADGTPELVYVSQTSIGPSGRKRLKHCGRAL
eukprot:2691878-Alexandrium_andersonii.AAC.1